MVAPSIIGIGIRLIVDEGNKAVVTMRGEVLVMTEAAMVAETSEAAMVPKATTMVTTMSETCLHDEWTYRNSYGPAKPGCDVSIGVVASESRRKRRETGCGGQCGQEL